MNKSFIVIQNLVDVDVDKNVDEKIDKKIDAFLKSSSIENDNRENFDDIIDFDAIFVQNICFFDVANKINSINVNKIIKNVENEINDEVNDEIIDDFEDIYENVTNNASFLDINKTSFVANFFA